MFKETVKQQTETIYAEYVIKSTTGKNIFKKALLYLKLQMQIRKIRNAISNPGNLHIE